MTLEKNSAPRSVNNEAEITLGVLNVVEQSSNVTQRSLAGELDIALGLANAYLKRCAKKGFIKITHVPRNRYAYFLTPKGFAEKSRLTGEYLKQSFNFFRIARSQCTDLLATCTERDWMRIAFAGAGDLAEIATLCARDHGIEIVGIIETDVYGKDEFAGLKVVSEPAELGPVDAVLITNMSDPQKTFDAMQELFPAERLFGPSFLRISRERPELMEG